MTAACTASPNASNQVAMRGPCASTSMRHLSGGGSPSSQEAAFMSWTSPVAPLSGAAGESAVHTCPCGRLQTSAPRCSLTYIAAQSYGAVEHALKQLFLLSKPVP